MRVSDFRFELPERLIATRPAEPRDAARLLAYERRSGECRHLQIRDLPGLLRAGDLLVINDTRVLPHRLLGRRATGGRVEVLILERRGSDCRGLVKPARKARSGDVWLLEERIEFTPVTDLGGGQFRFRLTDREGDLDAALEAVGRAPLPPYIVREARDEDVAADRERYQTVFARRDGAVAAPTAGLHFTPELLTALGEVGVEIATVTLHVGEGTFAPIRVEQVADHQMHREWFELPAATAAAVRCARAAGRRVIAVGTTAARTLESCAVTGDRSVRADSGETDLFLYPGRPLRVVDALLTNFHLPESTLLMLVSAFAGRREILEVYAEAVRREYRFFSFGDAMLIS